MATTYVVPYIYDIKNEVFTLWWLDEAWDDAVDYVWIIYVG